MAGVVAFILKKSVGHAENRSYPIGTLLLS